MPIRHRRGRRAYMPNHRYATKIQRAWRRRRRKYLPAKTSVRTGFLNVQQKELDTSFVLEAQPTPTGVIKKYNFQAANLTQWSTFASLFDQYRINGIKMTFLPTTAASDATVTNPGATFAWSVDLDGDNQITTFPELLECSNAHTSAWTSQGGLTPYKKIFLRPRAHDALITSLDATGQPATFSNGLAARKQWIDVSDRGLTTHYGLNVGWYFGNETINFDQHLNVIITYYMQFRKVR